MASGRQVIPVVKGLEKTVETGLHLDSLLPERENPPPECAKPLFSISYEELDLNGIETVFQLAKDELLSLRNFLVGRKKGQKKKENVLSIYGVISDHNEVIYCLTVESIFTEKLEFALSCPELSVKMVITGTGLADRAVYLKKSTLNFAMAKFKLESGTPITKQTLEVVDCYPENQISFHLTVNIECLGGAITNKGFGINQEIFLQKVFSLPEASKDVTIVGGDNVKVKVHKNILMAHSQASRPEFSLDTAEAKSRISLDAKSAEGLTMFVRCLYGFPIPIEVSPELALELFRLSHKYEVTELEVVTKNFLVKKGVEWYTVNSLLELYFYAKKFPRLEDVAEHALMEMSKLANQTLISSVYFKNLGLEDQRDLLLELWVLK